MAIKDGSKLVCLEVFAFPNSQLTRQVQEMSGSAERFTREDGDLYTAEGQATLWQKIYSTQPYHIMVAPECRLWGSWSRFNATRGWKAADRISRERRQERTILKLCAELCEYQVSRDRHFSIEQPQASSMWNQPEMRSLVKPTQPATFDMCRFNLRLPGSANKLRKRTTVRSTSVQIVASLHDVKCDQQHKHDWIAGNFRKAGSTNSVSKFSASYCVGFAKHVARQMCRGPHSMVNPADACPAETDGGRPLTRKRFKTPGGAVNVPDPAARKRPTASDQPARSRRARIRAPGEPETNPSASHAGSEDANDLWRRALQTVEMHRPHRGTAKVEISTDVGDLVQRALPGYKVVAMYVTTGAERLTSPLTAPSVSEAPWRISVGNLRHSGSLFTPPPDEREELNRVQRFAKCPACRSLLTILADIQKPPDTSPTSSGPNLESIPADTVAGAPFLGRQTFSSSRPGCLLGWRPCCQSWVPTN